VGVRGRGGKGGEWFRERDGRHAGWVGIRNNQRETIAGVKAMGKIKVTPSNGELAEWQLLCFRVLDASLQKYPQLKWVRTDDGFEAEIDWKDGKNVITCEIADNDISVEIDTDPHWRITEPRDGQWPISFKVEEQQKGDIFLVRFLVGEEA
jgi:hypothetical protein